jgi:para-aminobenzoate synthetase component 1
VTAESNYSVVDWFSYIAHEFPRAHTCLFDLGEQQIISASPEMFLCIDAHRTVKTEPIKGTARVVGFDAELLASRKEEAELAMITDLLRNDLSEVCDAGTVVVENDRKVQHLERITHTSSIISGKLKENISPIRALVSCFPGGSITGCPKSEAIKSIVQLEPNPRGFYTGCAFQILADGSLNSSILIRTLEKTGNQLKLGVGSGIVWDSNVEDEYQEMLNKAYLLTDLE